MMKSSASPILCGIGVVKTAADWLGSHGGEDSPDDVSCGLLSDT
jgi:hypothetical protein